jgi:hypothetical protein
VAVMLDPPHHSGGEETTLSALADGTLLAIGNGGASVFRSTVSTSQLNLVTSAVTCRLARLYPSLASVAMF